MHVKPKANLLSLSSYEEIIEALGGIGMGNDIAYIKATENKISSSALPSVNPLQGTLIVTKKWSMKVAAIRNHQILQSAVRHNVILMFLYRLSGFGFKLEYTCFIMLLWVQCKAMYSSHYYNKPMTRF